MIGRTLAHYRITGAIGAGGMGEVWRATDTRLGRDVALKILPEAFAADPDRLARFEREARVLASLNHPGIAHLYGFESANAADPSSHGPGGLLGMTERSPTHFLVMELVEGEDLAERLERGPVPVDEAIAIARQVAEALEEAHEKGIVHRDLKPANVKVTADGKVKVLDFGLAKPDGRASLPDSEEPTAPAGDTAPGTLLGTLAYMSPEQAKGLPVDSRSDQFSLGSMLHEMATGRHPFRRETPAETLSSILRDTPEPLTGSHSALNGVVRRLLAKRPEDRYESTGAMVHALRRLPSSPPAASIAVLPFENLSADPDHEYFSDGLAEEIVTDLSRIQGLKVISQASALRLKGSGKDLRTIGAELGVGHVLRGGVRRAGSGLRVTAQLIDVARDIHVWAEKYTGTLEDVFAIQESLSRKIVDALRLRLTSEEDRRIAERPIDDARAHDCYLRARHEYGKATVAGVEGALRYLDEGLEIVGPNALLYAAKGWAYLHLAIADTFRHRECLEGARHWAEKVFEIEPDSARGHGLLGIILADFFDPVAGTRHMDRASELDPSNLDNLTWFTLYDAFLGRPKAAGRAQLLLEQDALNPFSLWTAAFVRMSSGQFETAERLLTRAHAMDPEVPIYRTALAQVLVSQGRNGEALERLAAFDGTRPSHAWSILGLVLKRALEDDEAGALALLTEEVLGAFREDQIYAYLLAERYALLGRERSALDWLRASIEGGFWASGFMRSDALFRGLWDDPEFQRLVRLAQDKSEELP